jgi:hypothetical protein
MEKGRLLISRDDRHCGAVRVESLLLPLLLNQAGSGMRLMSKATTMMTLRAQLELLLTRSVWLLLLCIHGQQVCLLFNMILSMTVDR